MKKHVEFIPQGICSKKIEFDLKDNKVYNLKFHGGCPGNLQAIGSISEGQDVSFLVDRFAGIRCGMKKTSCVDQLTKALKKK